MDSTCYTIMFNYNSGMYHNQDMNFIILVILSKQYKTVKQYINGTLETLEIYVAKYQ